MTVFESLNTKTIDEIAEWLDEYVVFDDAPWLKWWDDNYCKECMMEDSERVWCELNGNCKFFKDKDEIPSSKEMIKMWLESETNEKCKSNKYSSVVPEYYDFDAVM